MPKTDKRSKKTIEAVQTTLLKLMCTQKISEIKIVDLCAAADINRTTFYLHFKCISDVLTSLKNEIVARVFEKEANSGALSRLSNPLPFLKHCTDVIDSYENFDNFVRSTPNADVFLTNLKNEFASEIYRRYEEKHKNSSKDAIFIIRFMTAGVLDTYTEWLKTDKSLPLETVLDKCAPMVSAGYRILAQLTEK